MNELGFRRVDDQVTYYGTLDDVVYRYPWGSSKFGRPLNLHALRGQMVTATIYDKAVILNDGCLIANHLLIPDVEDVSTSLIGAMVKGRAAYLYARGGEAHLIQGMERTATTGSGVKTHAKIMADTRRWPSIKNGLEEIEYHSRGSVIPWPRDKNMGHVFYLLMKSVREKTGAQTATTLPDHRRNDFDAIFARFEEMLNDDFDAARTCWEEASWTHFRKSDLDPTTLGTGNFTVEELRCESEYEDVRAMMNVANEMYHLAQSAGTFRGLQQTSGHSLSGSHRMMGVATALIDDHEGLLAATRETGLDSSVYSRLTQLMLSIPPDLKFTGDFSFIERFRARNSVKDARAQYLEAIWKFANSQETFDEALWARDEYARVLAELLHGHVIGSRIIRTAEQLGEVLIAYATAPLSPMFGWLVGIGKDSLKNQMFERVSKRRISVALRQEAISAVQGHVPMTRDLGLYIGPLEKGRLNEILGRVGPHSKVPQKG